MPLLITVGIALVSAIVGAITTLYIPLDKLPPSPAYGNVGFTSISTATNLADFPSTYNANMTAFDNGKIDVSTTTLPNLTTLLNLASVGTITTGTWSADVIAVAKNGTGTTSPTSNLIMLGNGSSGLKTVNGFGTSGQFLTSNGDATAPSWTTSSLDLAANYVWTGLHSFSNATSTNHSIYNNVWIGTSATSTLQGSATGTSTLQGFLNVLGTKSTSTFSGNIVVTGNASTSAYIRDLRI